MSFNLLEKRLQFAAQSPIHRDVHLTLNNTLNLAPNLVISPREFSHDDGKESGLFLGGLGAPNFSRDLDGFFARWHLESGAHVQHQMEESGFLIAWQEESEGKTKTRVFSLDNRAIEGDLALENKDDLSSALPEIICEKIADLRRRTSLIYPFLYEEYGSESLPFTVIIESFSPIIADDEETSSLPVSFFNVSIKAHENAHNLRVGVFFSWAHLSGWNAGLTTTCDRSKTPYPAQFSAGNSAKKGDKISAKNEIQSLSIIQTRQENRAVANSLEGQALIFVASAHKNAQLSYETCMKARGNRIGKAVHEQEYTLGFARHFFAQNLTLPQSDLTWNAHWDEALASAVCGAVNLKPNESATFNFGVVLDYPLVRFGKNRLWEARYTRRFGASGQNAQAIANTAFAELKNYQQTLYTAQQKHLEKHAPRLGKTLSLGLLNELYFLSGGGSVWVNQEAKLSNLPAPRLGNGEHFACLEGFDIGYYYYNTLDLWVYAFYAFSLNFPHIAETIFADYLAAASVKMPEMRMIYRDEQMRPMMEEGKLPHDFGAAPEDPWHDLNGYQMRDDCNAWLDHNPTFLISFFLHCRTQQRQLTKVEWQSVKKIALFMQSQSTGENGKNGLPLHQAFGDSTWDNIGLRGICAHSGAATLAAISAMIYWAKEQGENAFAEEWQTWLKKAQQSFDKYLWTGTFYRACEEGKYKECLMPDSLIWLMYAKKAGLPPILDEARIQSHLRASYEIAYKKFGFHGALLIAAPNQGQFAADGGDIGLQVNEVILGASWAFIAHALDAGLQKEAVEMGEDMMLYLQRDSGLQQRSPAAWDNQHRFRAPLNMRPLAVWLLA